MCPVAMISVSGAFSDLLTNISPEQRFIVVIVTIGCILGGILGLVGIISKTVGSIHRHRAEMDLKREMIDRGMSADDIAKIIESAAPPEDATQRLIASWAKPKSS
jgi:hypothetical protein